MSSLTTAARNIAVQDPDLTKLLGSNRTWGPWVFPDKPYVVIENKQKVMVVITVNGGWTTPNEHNTLKFPRMIVDVWADPTRNPDHSIREEDAKDKIDAVVDALKKNFHLTNKDVPEDAPAWMGLPRHPRIWGTPEEVQDRTGLRVLNSTQLGEPELSPVSDGNGAWMGRVYYGVTLG